MKSLIYISLAAAVLSGVNACKPEPDPVAPDLSDQLTRKYCNNPYAINYNDSFPGTPDSTRCIFPQDLYHGSWEITDSIYLADGELFDWERKTISFEKVDSEQRNEVLMTHWCLSTETVHLNINKTGMAILANNLAYPDSGQVVCHLDTLVGMGRYNVRDTDTFITFEIYQKAASGRHLVHKFTGEKVH